LSESPFYLLKISFDATMQLSMLVDMTASPGPFTSLSITRQCSQQLLHAAMNAQTSGQPQSCCGILTGADDTFSGMLAIPESALKGSPAESEPLQKLVHDFIGPDRSLSACFAASQGHAPEAGTQQASLCQWLQAQHLPEPQIYAVLEMTHKGRLEIHCYSDAMHAHEIPLTMQEDGTLYQQTSNY
jgi:hypothetical protein